MGCTAAGRNEMPARHGLSCSLVQSRKATALFQFHRIRFTIGSNMDT